MREKCINRELTTEVVVGAFMMTVLLGLGCFTIILSRETWFRKQQHIEVIFDSVMGLRSGDSVVCRGMPIGKVGSLELKRDGVHVVANLDSPVELRTDYRITVATTSMLGGQQMVIEEGSRTNALAATGIAYTGLPPYDILDDAAMVVNGLRKGLIDDGTVDNIRTASEQLRDIVLRANAGEGFLGRMLSSDEQLFNDLAASMASLREISSRLENGESSLGKLLSEDDTLYQDLSQTVASLRVVAAGLESGKGTLGKLMNDEDEVYQDLAASVASVKTITKRLEDGEGLMGRILTDEKLYDDVAATVKEAREAIEDMRETSPITTFSSVFFGAL